MCHRDGGRGKELCSVSKDPSLDFWLLLRSNNFSKAHSFRQLLQVEGIIEF